MALFCNECSREVGEQVFGTAPRVDVWLLLEFTGAWGVQAVPESELPPEVKARLIGWGDSIPNTKVQLIKQGEKGAKIPFFVALTSLESPVVYKFDLDSYDDLLAFDLDAVLRRESRYEDNVHRDPLILVCTNGRRDISCAKYGLPVYQALAEQTPGWAWESTHIGGHRFAGTLVTLPDGVYYGRLDVDDVPELVAAQMNRYLLVERVRGRVVYDQPTQDADYYLRGITGERLLDGLRFVSIREIGERHWSVRFAADDGHTHEVQVRRAPSEWVAYESSTDAEARHFPQFHLVEHAEMRRKAPRCEG